MPCVSKVVCVCVFTLCVHGRMCRWVWCGCEYVCVMLSTHWVVDALCLNFGASYNKTKQFAPQACFLSTCLLGEVRLLPGPLTFPSPSSSAPGAVTGRALSSWHIDIQQAVLPLPSVLRIHLDVFPSAISASYFLLRSGARPSPSLPWGVHRAMALPEGDDYLPGRQSHDLDLRAQCREIKSTTWDLEARLRGFKSCICHFQSQGLEENSFTSLCSSGKVSTHLVACLGGLTESVIYVPDFLSTYYVPGAALESQQWSLMECMFQLVAILTGTRRQTSKGRCSSFLNTSPVCAQLLKFYVCVFVYVCVCTHTLMHAYA